MTLDEWKAQQAKKDGPKFNLRKAGEGSDLDPKWKKTYAYKKERETHEDDEDEVSILFHVLTFLQQKFIKVYFIQDHTFFLSSNISLLNFPQGLGQPKLKPN